MIGLRLPRPSNAALTPLAAVAGTLAVWEFVVRAGIVAPIFFPLPTVIARTVFNMLQSGELPAHVVSTLSRIAFGMLVGGLPAVGLGLAMGWSSRLRSAVDPLIAASHVLPKIALLPLLMIMLGVGELPKLAIAVMGTFFPLLINTMTGARLIHPIHFEVASNYGARPRQVFTKVLLPGSLPLIVSGLRLAFNSTLLLTVAAEMISAQDGLGVMIWRAWETMRTEELYTSLVCIVVIGLAANALLGWLGRRLVPWHIEREL